MKRNLEDQFGQEMQSKRFTSPLLSPQYIPQAQQQQSNAVLSRYQFIPYPGNLMYTRHPQWPLQTPRYGNRSNLPPPPMTPPPSQPPPPRMNSMTSIFDLTQPPPPIGQNLNSPSNNANTTSFNLPSISSGNNQHRLINSSNIRLPLRGRNPNGRGLQIRQKSMHTSKAITTTNIRQSSFTNVEDADGKRIVVSRKSKRKPMSARYMRSKEWERQDAEKALQLENEFNKMQKTPMLILKFPDPDLNKHIVKKYSSAIDSVHFQQPSTPRYCFVTLKEGHDIEKVRKELCEVSFGVGKIVAEQKFSSNEECQPLLPEEIDPYTLYIGNLPTKICVKTVKENFPGAARIDIGYAQRMKYTRYAFIRYNNVHDAMEAFKRTFNTPIGNRSLIVRFRRSKGNIGLPGETRISNASKKVQEAIKQTDKDVKNNNIKVLETTFGLKDSILNDEQIKLGINQDGRDNIEKEVDSTEVIESSINDNGISGELLGTRIKEEPVDDDELLACARTYNMMDDDYDDEEPSDDDEFSENKRNSRLFGDQMQTETTATSKCLNNSNNFGVPQSYEQLDIKPDFSTLPPIPHTSNYGYNHSRYGYSKNQQDIFNSRFYQFNCRKNERVSKANEKDDDEDDIFDDLNADDDFDVIGAF